MHPRPTRPLLAVLLVTVSACLSIGIPQRPAAAVEPPARHVRVTVWGDLDFMLDTDVPAAAFDLRPAAGDVSQIRGGHGDTVGISLARLLFLDLWLGMVRIRDPHYGVDAHLPIVTDDVRRDATGNTTVTARGTALTAGLTTARFGMELALSESSDDSDPVLVGAGDISLCLLPMHFMTANLLDDIPGTVFTLGDNAYPDGKASEFACYDLSWGRHRERTRPSPGNHDYHQPGAGPYYAYYGSAAGPPGKGWYSYELGAWHIVVLNSNCGDVPDLCAPDSEQIQWLRADLAASEAVCTAAYFHHPRFSSSANHGSDPAMQVFWDVLYEAGAEIVLAGHDHTYERFAPQTPEAVADPATGIREFVVGTGGNVLYGFGAPEPNSEVRNASTWGVLQLTLHDDSYEWEFVPVQGQWFTDVGTTACHGAPA